MRKFLQPIWIEYKKQLLSIIAAALVGSTLPLIKGLPEWIGALLSTRVPLSYLLLFPAGYFIILCLIKVNQRPQHQTKCQCERVVDQTTSSITLKGHIQPPIPPTQSPAIPNKPLSDLAKNILTLLGMSSGFFTLTEVVREITPALHKIMGDEMWSPDRCKTEVWKELNLLQTQELLRQTFDFEPSWDITQKGREKLAELHALTEDPLPF